MHVRVTMYLANRNYEHFKYIIMLWHSESCLWHSVSLLNIFQVFFLKILGCLRIWAIGRTRTGTDRHDGRKDRRTDEQICDYYMPSFVWVEEGESNVSTLLKSFRSLFHKMNESINFLKHCLENSIFIICIFWMTEFEQFAPINHCRCTINQHITSLLLKKKAAVKTL